jgi:hypothetical protein
LSTPLSCLLHKDARRPGILSGEFKEQAASSSGKEKRGEGKDDEDERELIEHAPHGVGFPKELEFRDVDDLT